ncbi:GL10081 [Drosophila persimilis]|uniref:GL10081 n=1 Tax=Drosophila persimilis TaxID=7234 RepID=B4H5B5_DROPE|nr:RNA/RNP complex-1-interacting phosphatase [Drosophila persimilis]EDW32951.1 GL10081 [Drosophila persimilis]
MKRGVPDRWLDYSPIGKRVPGTRFIAFKVPLNQNLNEKVDKELRLGPESVMESVPNLGMIIDLTNTDRYYRPQSFTENDVRHQKLMIPGKATPPTKLAQKFCQYAMDFLELNEDNDKLIGVHCTHGVNRTGYLICYFMITMLNKSPLEAIATVDAARGHKIERENYLSSLLRLGNLKSDVDEPSHDTGYANHYNRRPAWNGNAGGRQQQYQYQRPYDNSQDDSRQSNWRSNWNSNNGYHDLSRSRYLVEDRERHQPEVGYRSNGNGWPQQGRQQYQDRSRDRDTGWRRPQQDDRANGWPQYHGNFRHNNSEWKSPRNGSGNGDDPEWNKPHWNGSNHSNNWRQSHYQSRNEHNSGGHETPNHRTYYQPYNNRKRDNRYTYFSQDN